MQTACPKCFQIYPVPNDALGKTARCKKCGETFKVEPFVELDLEMDNEPSLPKKETPKPKTKRYRKSLKTQDNWIVAVSVMFFLIFAWIYSEYDSRPKKSVHSVEMAYVMAQNFVEKKLRSPSTADFASLSQASIQHLGSGRYQIVSWVDAQNAFGATIRNEFICELHKDSGNTWTLDSLDFIP